MKNVILACSLLYGSMMFASDTHRYDHRVRVVRIHDSESLLSRVPRSVLKTMRHHPFFTALAFWAIAFSRETIVDHPFVTALIAADLLSEFSIHMLKEN